MLKLAMSLLAPSGRRGRLSILIFHRVLAQRDPLDPALPVAAEFEQRMRWVRDWFNVLPLADAVDQLFEGRLPSRALAITFDDGYADNEEIAAPILARLGMHGTFFVSTGFLDGGCMWNDRVIESMRACPADSIDLQGLGLGVHDLSTPQRRGAAIETVLGAIKHLDGRQRLSLAESIRDSAGRPPLPRLMMGPDQVRSLVRQGMEIGGHTVTHPILSRLAADEAHAEMLDGKRTLEVMTGRALRVFAYPNGIPGVDYGAEHARMASECGFASAVSTAWGAGSSGSDRFQMPRFTPWDRSRLRYGLRMAQNFTRREQRAPSA